MPSVRIINGEVVVRYAHPCTGGWPHYLRESLLFRSTKISIRLLLIEMTRMLSKWAAFEAGVVHREYLPAPTEGGRMSSENRPYLTSADLSMLERVLARSNFPRSVHVLRAEARSDAARVLIAQFQRGVSSEARLCETLSEFSAVDDYPDEAVGYDTAVSIAAVNMPTILPGVQYGYGKHVDADKSRTIHHVFAGAPVGLGARDLINLDVITAVRALRLLNSAAATKPEAR